MNRIGVLSTLVMMFMSSHSFAQFGGMGGSGGQGMAPGMVAQGMATSMVGQRGNTFVPGSMDIRISVQVEMEGGQRLIGKIDLRTLTVDGDLGQYAIAPDKIKMIRFLKPANEAEEDGDREAVVGEDGVVARPRPQGRGAAIRPVRQGGGGGFRIDPSGMAVLTRGKVTTTTDKEIIGTIHIPTEFRLDLEFGSLNLAPGKLRSITIMSETRKDRPAQAGSAALHTPDDAGRGPSAEAASPPRYFRQGKTLLVVSSVGDRVTLFDLDTRKSQSLELSASKDATLEVIPISAQNLVALRLRGSRITRIAVADTASGTWHPQELRTPAEGQALPILGDGVVVYNLGREIYAYSAEAQRWDVAELPEGVRAMPVVGPGTATIDSHGHIYTFAGKSGRWEHIDVRAILDGVAAEQK
jgi:hypothetical protein